MQARAPCTSANYSAGRYKFYVNIYFLIFAKIQAKNILNCSEMFSRKILVMLCCFYIWIKKKKRNLMKNILIVFLSSLKSLFNLSKEILIYFASSKILILNVLHITGLPKKPGTLEKPGVLTI